MANNGGVWVFYFFQGEDGDSVENPNAFNVKSAANQVRLGQFLQHFPLRGHGNYHFRFRAPDQLSGYCWMDVNDPSMVLPRYDNVICAKALRLDRLPKPRSARLRRKAPYGAVAATVARSGGTTSWRKEQEQRRPAQEFSGSRHGQWQGRPRSESPANHHQHQMHADLRNDASKGRSTTPPASHGSGSGRGTATARGPPPPQPPPPPENLETFLFSDSPTGSPGSSPRVGSDRDFQNGETAPRSSGGESNSSGVGRREHSSRGDTARAGSNRESRAAEGKSGEDLLNFGSDSHAAAAAAAAGSSAAAAPPPLPKRPLPGGRGAHPPGWGNRAGGGASPPGRKSTSGRMQGAPGGLGVRPNGIPGSNGPSGGGGEGGASNNAHSNVRRPASFSGEAGVGGGGGGGGGGSGGDGPDLMNVNPSGRVGGKSAYVASKVEEREQKVEEAVQAAVQENRVLKAAAAKDQEDLDAAKAKYGAMLTAWAEDHGKKRNVRTLLSTMHTVLWEGNRWKPVAMADIIQPSKVKMPYRKAMLLVHPDKCGSLGPEQRLIAKRVFEAVNEAYAVFAEKELSG